MKGLFHICLAIASLIFTSCLKDALPQQEGFCLDFSVEGACAKVAQGSCDGEAIPLLWETGDMMYSYELLVLKNSQIYYIFQISGAIHIIV